MDKYSSVRSLSFPTLASVLGIDMARFKRRRDEWQGYCPVHQSKNNNGCFSYNDTGKWHCFSCNAKGSGAIDLTMAVKTVNFTQACEILGQAPKDPPKEKTPRGEAPVASDGVPKPLEKDSWRKFQVPCPWLEQRIPDAAVRQRYGVFMYNNPARKSAYSGRVMLPVKDVQGQLMGYLGRALPPSSGESLPPDVPKYLFPRGLEKSKYLFGAWELLQSGRQDGQDTGRLPLKVVWLLESPFAVMKFAMYGLPAVSPFGWSISDEQLSILRQVARGLVYIPDRNKYEEATAQCGRIAQSHLWITMPPLPDGIEDPEYLTREQILAL